MSQPALQTPQQSLIKTMAGKYGLEANTFKSTVVKTLFPSDKQNPTNEQVAAFLVVANQYNLNPFIKEIYAFPGKGGGIIPIVSIDGWNTIINRHPQYDGVEFCDELGKDNELIAITAKVYRKDRSHPIMVTEYMKECARNTDPWRQYPARMLRHKALIQAARYAFGFAGIYDPDEAERIAMSNGNDGLEPIPIAVISEEQRAELVALAQKHGVVEKLGEIVNAAGFEMLAHITVDRYKEIENAISGAGNQDPDVQHVDAQIIAPDETEETETSPIFKKESARLDLLSEVNDLIIEITGGEVTQITEYTGGNDIGKWTTGQLKDLKAELLKKKK